MSKKIWSFLGVILIIFCSFCGCKKQGNGLSESEKKKYLVNEKQAVEVVEKYIGYIAMNDFENARKLCDPELANKTQDLYNAELEIVDYLVSDISQAGGNVVVRVKVNRIKRGVPRADVDLFIVKVSKKNGENYKIQDVKASIISEAYEEGDKIKSISADDPKSKTVIKLTNVPKDMYPKSNKANILKKTVPDKQFGAINYAISGKKMAISTRDDKGSYIATLEIEEAVPTIADKKEEGEGKEDEKEEKEDEKPLAKKIKSVDIYDNAYVNALVFSQDDNYLAVEYIEQGSGRRLKIYGVSETNLVDADFDQLFPKDKYEIVFSKFGKNEVFFDIKALKNAKDSRQDVVGKYKLDIKDLKVMKL
ncbi:hypothetical protein CPJCM30710_16580 [Clostridium polyendosporum]|uniref:Lipoprotein n=1 Tax=Clostridium polyendosporum TaxID=69208 RepID=A0A919RYU6_9CLOT|nr:hypothetical protein [Clostridium polyendosporum]GIM28992.1 hypothetical protein CPJCM30710_16580 [Clostridium polyendosporum]